MATTAFPGEDTTGAPGKLQSIVDAPAWFRGFGALFGSALLDTPPQFGMEAPFSVYSNGSGMAVRVRPGVAVVMGFPIENRVEEILSIDPVAGGTRTDLVVLSLYMNGTDQSLTLSVVKGTSTARGVATRQLSPYLVWQLELAYVTVAAGQTSILPSNVLNVAQQQKMLGSRPSGQVAYSEDTVVHTTQVDHQAMLSLPRCTFSADPSRAYKITFHAYRIDAVGANLPTNPTCITRMLVKPGGTVAVADTAAYQVNASATRPEYGVDFSARVDGLSGPVTVGISIEPNNTDAVAKTATNPGSPATDLAVQVVCGGSIPAYLLVEDIGAA